MGLRRGSETLLPAPEAPSPAAGSCTDAKWERLSLGCPPAGLLSRCRGKSQWGQAAANVYGVRAVAGLRAAAVNDPSLHRRLFFPLSARFSGLPCAEGRYLMFSDSCPFCCQCWCPRSHTKLSNCLRRQHAPPASRASRPAAAVSVCLSVYMIYIHTSPLLSVSVCVHSRTTPMLCWVQRCTTVHLPPAPCHRVSCVPHRRVSG